MSSNSPCAACKFQRRKCVPDCIFAPYFPPEDPQKFVNVHNVFGGKNVAKILKEINPSLREDAAKSLAYEAEARLNDPIHGCVALIAYLQQRLKQIQLDLENAKKELASYVGPSAMLTTFPQYAYGQMVFHPQHQMMGNPSASASGLPYTNLMGAPPLYGAGTSHQQQMMGSGNPSSSSSSSSALPYTSLMPSMMGAGGSSQPVLISEQQQQHGSVDSRQYGAVAATMEQHELMRSYEQQQDYFLFKSSDGQYDQPAGVVQIAGSEFIQMAADETGGEPSLALGVNFDNPYSHQIQQQQNENVHHALQAQLILQSHQQHPEQALQKQLHQRWQHKVEGDEGRSNSVAEDPSC